MAGNLRLVRDRGDYFAFLKQRRRESEIPSIRRWSWFLGSVAFAVTLALLAVARLPMTPAAVLLAVAAFFGIWWTALWASGPLFEGKMYPLPDDFTEPVDLSLNENGIQAANRLGTTFYAWSSLSDIVQTETHYFVRKGRATVIVVPRRLFDANSDASQFLLDLRNSIRAS
jgi:hypothetical protein